MTTEQAIHYVRTVESRHGWQFLELQRLHENGRITDEVFAEAWAQLHAEYEGLDLTL